MSRTLGAMRAEQLGITSSQIPCWMRHYTSFALGQAYIETGQLDKAVSRLEKCTNDYSEFRLYDPVTSVLTHYYLGIAYEKSGWNDRAAEQFEKFLGLWHKADPNLKEVADARNRLMKLRS